MTRMPPPMPEVLEITVDADDRIVSVGGCWDGSARQGSAGQLAGTQVIGRLLADFISGDSTLMYVDTLLQSARLQARVLTRQYRCDSPTEKRFMEMRLTPLTGGLVHMTHRLLKTMPLRRPIRFATVAPPSLHLRCSSCNSVRIGHGDWLAPDHPMLTERPMPDDIPVAYGICPRCQERLRKLVTLPAPSQA